MNLHEYDQNRLPQHIGFTFERLAIALANDYQSIYVINCEDDSYVEYVTGGPEKMLCLHSSGEDFYADTRKNCRILVYPEDQEHFLEVFNKANVNAALENAGSFTLNYRLVVNGKPQYYFLKTIRGTGLNDKHIIIGVQNIHEQRLRELKMAEESRVYSHIAGALASRYEVIYYIDIVTNAYTQYSVSKQYAKLGSTKQGDDFFADADRDIRQFIHPDDMERILYELNRERLLRHLDQTGSVSLTYRQLFESGSRFVTMLAVRPKNDQNRIVIGVLDVDVQVRREQQIAAQNITFSEIAEALAKRYEVIYHVDLQTNEYAEYSSSEKYRSLEIGARGKDFFADSQRNMKRDIYPEDYPMMAKAMEKESLLRSLRSTGTTTLNYRLILDSRPQYVTLFVILPKEDSNHIIVAVANVDAAKRREIEFRDALGSAMDMANRDALTGVKNKHAYVQAEIEMDALIGAERNPPFAIVVCDINGLKRVNDTQGHSAGDAFIKSACSIICQTFKHSPVFRIGGDEFTIILKGDDYMNRDTLIRCFGAIQEEQLANGLVTVAFGISCFDAAKDMRLQDVFERADSAMYDNKKHGRHAT